MLHTLRLEGKTPAGTGVTDPSRKPLENLKKSHCRVKGFGVSPGARSRFNERRTPTPGAGSGRSRLRMRSPSRGVAGDAEEKEPPDPLSGGDIPGAGALRAP